jgi:hypothetical protein
MFGPNSRRPYCRGSMIPGVTPGRRRDRAPRREQSRVRIENIDQDFRPFDLADDANSFGDVDEMSNLVS